MSFLTPGHVNVNFSSPHIINLIGLYLRQKPFSRHSGTCHLLRDRKHAVAHHTLQVGDFLRVGSVECWSSGYRNDRNAQRKRE
jgi:hypothetical protein